MTEREREILNVLRPIQRKIDKVRNKDFGFYIRLCSLYNRQYHQALRNFS